MGHWGYGPFDNDTAADMVARLADHVRQVVHARTMSEARESYDEARVAIQVMLLAHGKDILGGPSAVMAIEALALIRRDVEMFSGSKEPLVYAQTIEKEARQIIAKMIECGRCEEKEIVAAIKMMWDATAVPVPPPRDQMRKPNRIVALARRRRARRKSRKTAKKRKSK